MAKALRALNGAPFHEALKNNSMKPRKNKCTQATAEMAGSFASEVISAREETTVLLVRVRVLREYNLSLGLDRHLRGNSRRTRFGPRQSPDCMKTCMDVQYLAMVSEPADEQTRRPRQLRRGVVTLRKHGASIGENMFRFAIQGVVLLAFASTAAAGEHYIEIWNPPEARLPQASASGKGIAEKRPAISRHASRAAPRRVADAVARSVPGKRVSDTLKKPITPRPTDIPRIMTPEGNVLRVKYTGSQVQVVR